MESVLGRYRNLIILVGVLFLQVLGLAMQVKRGGNDAESTRLIRVWMIGAISPFERGLVWIENGTSNVWHSYFYLRGLRAENRQLKDQIEQMRLEQVRLSQDAAQAHRLQTLLAFKEQYISKTVAAQVIGSSGSDQSRIIYIDKGEDEGVRRDMAVITADGVVGKILMAFKNPSVSQVLLINDQSSGVGAILEKTRLQGVLRGTSAGEVVLERVMSDEQVPIGEAVLTSGGDQIFPKGLPIGTVTKVGNGKDLFLNIKVKPAANLSRLEEVLVLVQKQERTAMAEEKATVRAADILAQRLPSVPDKPKDATPGAASGTPKPGASKPGVSAGAAKPLVPTTAAQAGKNPPAVGAVHSTAGTAGTNVSSTPAPKTSSSPAPAVAKPKEPDTKPADQPHTTPPTPPTNAQPTSSENSPQ